MTNPKFDRDEKHKIDFLRRYVGRVVWMGVRSDDKEVHGHRYWILGKIDRTEGGTLFCWIRKSEIDEWKRVSFDQIVRAARDEPKPEMRDYLKEWDQGLSQKPGVDALLSEAARHQLDGDAGAR